MKSDDNKKTTEPPEPELLKTQDESSSESKTDAKKPAESKPKKRALLKHKTYRPSHKATFIGIAVVVVILAVNVGVIAFLSSSQEDAEAKSRSEVVISPVVLDKLGVSRNAIGDTGTELVVGPNSRFDGKLTVGSDVSIGGDLKLNSKFSATDASLANLQAGDTSIEELNVNGDASATNLSLRKDLTVDGTTRLQGTVTVSQLLTVNNNVNIAGSLSVGGSLSVRSFQASSLVSDTTLTIGGHIITRGSAPGISGGGSALGSNGTVSISGNDASGTVAANIGVGAGTGLIAQVYFKNKFAATPHVVVSPVGRSANFYVNRNASGFSIYVSSSLPAGGILFDYIVMQ